MNLFTTQDLEKMARVSAKQGNHAIFNLIMSLATLPPKEEALLKGYQKCNNILKGGTR